MSKNEELKDLFRDVFVVNQEINKDYWGSDIDKFCCNCIDSCGYNRNETKRTCGIGDEKSSVLIIGEAPSSSGDGEKTSIPFSNLPIKGKSPQYKIRDFIVEKYNGLVPFFTDSIKCGVVTQNEKKLILDKRKDNCYRKFLLYEIKITYPDVIVIIDQSIFGKFKSSKDKIQNDLLGIGFIPKRIQIINLYHYSYIKRYCQGKFDEIWNEQFNEPERTIYLFDK